MEARVEPLAIKFIVATECFYVDGRYRVKELGGLDVDSGESYCRYYRVGRLCDLNARDRFQAIWSKNHIHGLMYEDRPSDEPPEKLMHLFPHLGREAGD